MTENLSSSCATRPRTMQPLKKLDCNSSVALQMSIYFNAFFSPCWLIAHVYTLTQKYELMNPTQQAIATTLHLLMTTVEFCRLYFGFIGNLTESVPQLSGFWVATLLLQLPICLYLTFSNSVIGLPLDISVDVVQISFILFQLLFGLRTIVIMAKAQYNRFREEMATTDLADKTKTE